MTSSLRTGLMLAAGMCLALTLPAQASAAPPPPTSAATASAHQASDITIIGPLTTDAHGTVSTSSLDRALDRQSGMTGTDTVTGTDTTAARATPAAVSPIRHSWRDYKGRYTPIRAKALHKIETQHNVTYKVARATTKYPAPGHAWHVSGHKWNYETPVYHVKCSGWLWWRKCRVVQKVWVLAAVDFRHIADHKPYGVVTTYCKGMQRCPNYVKNALNV